MKNKGNGKETIMQNANEQNRSDKDEIDIGKSEEREKKGGKNYKEETKIK